MALGALMATAGYLAFRDGLVGSAGGLYVGGAIGVVLFVVGMITVIRGR
jgi:hypothetical protein